MQRFELVWYDAQGARIQEVFDDAQQRWDRTNLLNLQSMMRCFWWNTITQ